MGGEELKWRQLKHNQLMNSQGPGILVHAVQLKPTIKVQISGRMSSIGISDIVTTSVYYSEKNRLKKLMMMMKMIIIIISNMNKS